MRMRSFNPPGTVNGELLLSGYMRIADGPWACYVCAVFGDTLQSWNEHAAKKHPVRPYLVPLGQMVAPERMVDEEVP